MFQRKTSYLYTVTIIFLGLIIVGQVDAYRVQSKYPGAPNTSYSIDPNLRAKLSASNAVQGSPNPADLVRAAANTWNRASRFAFLEVGWQGTNIITAQNYDTTLPPCVPENDINARNYVAVTCISPPNSLTNTSTDIYMNSASWIEWHTDGVQDHSRRPLKENVQSNALHELGHWLTLGHGNNTATVMLGDGSLRTNLHYDDKKGATQIYGPWTGFEDYHAEGVWHTPAFRQNVAGYFNTNNPGPELSNIPSEFGVTPNNGSKMNRMTGYAVSSYSYCYFKSFTWEDDTNQIDLRQRPYVTIRSGMKLRWYQYNYQQSTMGVDFTLIDPVSGYQSSLRDSGLTDQNGVRVHPSARGGYATGRWHYFEVDLTPLQGKKIIQYLFAYDNGGNGRTGQFRAYFDDYGLIYN